MRKIIVLSMITLDGVMQAPGGPEKLKQALWELRIHVTNRKEG